VAGVDCGTSLPRGRSRSSINRIALLVLVAFALVAGDWQGFPQASAGGSDVPAPSTITTLSAPEVAANTSTALPGGPTRVSLAPATNALVSANAASVSLPQTEPSVASNSVDRKKIIAGYMDFVFGWVAGRGAVPGVSRSADGGRSWNAPSGGATLPNPPSATWGRSDISSGVVAGDPSLAWSVGNTLYYATLGFQYFSMPATPGVCNVGGIYVYRSVDGGDTWTLPAGGPAIANTQTVFRDKEYLAVDASPNSAYAGTIYMAWDDDVYSGCPQQFPTNFVTRRIMFSKSTDQGQTWTTALTLAAGCLVSPVPAVGPDGSVYVVWFDCNSGDRQLVRKSVDGGNSFEPAVTVATGFRSPRFGDTQCPNPLPGATFRVNAAFPMIATDSVTADNIYVAWFGCPADQPGQADVFFSRSSTGGAIWSSALRVNDDAVGNPRDQFFPWLTVDDIGVIRMMWGDDRLDIANAGGHVYDVFSAESVDHGASFGANIRVTNQSSDPDLSGFDNPFTPEVESFIGDYFGIAPCGTPLWADTRNGNQDIFAAAPTGAPASDCDGVPDSVESACGSDPANAEFVPERVDGAFAGLDDDGDLQIDEALPPGSEAYDCDGDGYMGSTEKHVYGVANTVADQDPCGTNVIPPTTPATAKGWPSDLRGDSFNVNRVNIQDLGTFVAPVRRIETYPGHPNFHLRWDLKPMTPIGVAHINLLDLNALVNDPITGYPPMLGGQKAFGGPVCPWAP